MFVPMFSSSRRVVVQSLENQEYQRAGAEEQNSLLLEKDKCH
jgi:hypothetical protein